MSTRAQAARALAPVIQQKASLSATFDPIAAKIAAKERPLLKELCFGVARHFFSLQQLSKKLLSKPLKDKDSDVHALILLGLYQLRNMRTPDHAAISETVNAARNLKKPWAAKVINGVLRNYLRQQDKLQQQLIGFAPSQTEHPQWLLDSIKQAWPEHWRAVIDANNTPGPLTLRVNRRKCTRDDLMATLKDSGHASVAAPFSDAAIRLEQSQDITLLPGFAAGHFSVQDEAPQLSADLLDLPEGGRVLDACCAPGGKTCHILEHSPNAQVVAVELEETRMLRVRENLQRLGLSAELHVADACATETWWDGKLFDRILLDAPCSATGVIRRHPDIKLLRRAEDIEALASLQQQLLSALWPLLAPGGLMIYATCSILPQENQENVAKFVEAQPDALHLPIDSAWGIACTFGRQLLPTQGGHDGFYYARLQKHTEHAQRD